jgi:hypothetical protein
MIAVPDRCWDLALDLLLVPKGDVERVVFLDGVVAGAGGVVTTVVAPDADLHASHYDISARQMSAAGKHLRANRLRRIAQVHTHGFAWVGHSRRDDEMAYSNEDGALSIVVPFHARKRPRLTDCGIHRCEGGRWRRLIESEVATELRVVPGVLDLREGLQDVPARRSPRFRAFAALGRAVRG